MNFDFVLAPDGNGHDDLYIDPQTGDFVIGPSDEQHIQDTINAYPGWWKQYPADGVGVRDYLNSTRQTQSLSRAIKMQLQADGYSVGNPSIQFSNGKLTINPDASI